MTQSHLFSKFNFPFRVLALLLLLGLHLPVFAAAATTAVPRFAYLDSSVYKVDSVTGALLNDSGATTPSQWRVSGPVSQMKVYVSNSTPGAGQNFAVNVVALPKPASVLTVQGTAFTINADLKIVDGRARLASLASESGHWTKRSSS